MSERGNPDPPPDVLGVTRYGWGGNIAGILDVLKAQPLMLGLLLVIFALIGFVYLQSSQFNSQRAENVKLFLDVQKETQKIISQCVVPTPK